MAVGIVRPAKRNASDVGRKQKNDEPTAQLSELEGMALVEALACGNISEEADSQSSSCDGLTTNSSERLSMTKLSISIGSSTTSSQLSCGDATMTPIVSQSKIDASPHPNTTALFVPDMSVPYAPDNLPERFRIMVQQEMTSYKVEEYLNPSFVYADSTTNRGDNKGQPSECSSAVVTCSSKDMINENWRKQICAWLYKFVDHHDFDREIVAVCLCYIDRYLSKRPVNKRTFQLLAMTSLHLASKLYRNRNLFRVTLSNLVELGRGYFIEKDIVAMEQDLLDTLSWKVHPPTPLTFVHHFVGLLNPRAVVPHLWSDMMEVAKFLTELAVIDYHFVRFKNSSVGLAALMTAMDGLSETVLSDAHRQEFAFNVYRVAQINPNDSDILDCRNRLRTMYKDQQKQKQKAVSAAKAAPEVKERDDRRLASEVPVSVVAHPVVLSPLGIHEIVASYDGASSLSGLSGDVTDSGLLTTQTSVLQVPVEGEPTLSSGQHRLLSNLQARAALLKTNANLHMTALNLNLAQQVEVDQEINALLGSGMGEERDSSGQWYDWLE